MSTPEDVLSFWFGASPATNVDELKQKLRRWYLGGKSEDTRIAERFQGDVESALGGGLDAWAATPSGRLALILVLDQFPRSIFRGDARAFDGNLQAQRLAVEALDAGLETKLSFEHRQFLLMPLLHAENVGLLERFGVEVRKHVDACPEWARELLSSGLEQAEKYRAVVARFGRFPHRNEALGRTSTPEEIEFLVGWADRAPPKVARELL